ncbi:MAG: hypothetical protein WDZ91_15555, partial [Paenibacillaceae bacterium]
MGKAENLKYSNQEHVIPAGLGGITKLPHGYVSDEANKFFSPYELRALRNSFLSVNRDNNGPGRRGSLNVQSIREPMIRIFEAVSPEKELDTLLIPFRLGFLFSGIVQILPQIYIRFDEMWNMKRPLYVADNFSKNPEESLSQFRTLLAPFFKNNHRKWIFIDTPISTSIKFVSIGYYDEKYFVCSSIQPFRMNNFADLILLRPLPELHPFLLSSAATYNYSHNLGDLKDPAFPLVYIKTAFNALAFFMGQSFVLQSIFDPVRNSIWNVADLDQFWIKSSMPEWLVNWVTQRLPTKVGRLGLRLKVA